MTLAWPENKICERRFSKSLKEKGNLAPRAGLEPATLRLTAECSTVELPGNRKAQEINFNTAGLRIQNGEPFGSQALSACRGRQAPLQQRTGGFLSSLRRCGWRGKVRGAQPFAFLYLSFSFLLPDFWKR